MTVTELIAKLQTLPPDAKVYYEVFLGFAKEDEHLPLEQRREECVVYGLDVEFKTVLNVPDVGPVTPYTGVFFQID